MVPRRAIDDFNDRQDWERVTAQVVLIELWLESQFKKVNSGQLLTIDLDAFQSDPAIQLERLQDFMDLPANRAQLDTVVRGVRSQTASGLAVDSNGINALAEEIRANYEF